MSRRERDAKDAAFDRGARDWRKSKGLASSNPLTEFFHPSYSPPKGRKGSYDEGRRYAERHHKKRR